MDYLGLVNRLRQEAGITSSKLLSLSNAVGEAARCIDWIAQAWEEIQTAEVDWDWLRGSVSFPTVAQKPTYTPAECGLTDFARWKTDSFRTYVTAVGMASEIWLEPIQYDDWRNKYQFSSFRTTYSRPLVVTVTPAKALGFGPIPGPEGYTVVGEYFKVPQVLVADTDTPKMPERYHMAIVYLALRYYALYEAAPEALQRAEDGYRRLMTRIRLDQLPAVQMAGALA